MPPTAILILKAPAVGTVKTRLATTIGPTAATQAYRALVRHQLQAIPPAWPVEIHFTPPEAADTMRSWLGSRHTYIPQSEGDLGQRLTHATQPHLNYPRILLGGDCPYITRELLLEAARFLETCEAVMIPALDGGYCLLGLIRAEDHLFENIHWSTPEVAEQTRTRLRAAGISWHELPPLEDVDDAPGWQRAINAFPTLAQPQGTISVVIPAWREDAALLARALEYRSWPEVREVIIAAAGDPPACEQPGITWITCATPSRGAQLNAGGRAATGEWLLFHHADTDLTHAHVRALAAVDPAGEVVGGAFYRRFDERHPVMRRFESWERWHNRSFGALYGDQSIFVPRHRWLAMGGFAAIPIMEDTELSLRLRRLGRVLMLDPAISSSPRKHLREGSWRTTLRNLRYVILYRLGVTPASIYASYYKKGRSKPMKLVSTLILAITLVLTSTLLAGVGDWQKEYDVLLKKYVAGEGVRYAAWKESGEDMAALQKVVAAIGEEKPDSLPQKDQLAFYINAYNAWTIKLILDKYPLKSVRDHSPLFGVFTGKNIRVAGERMSLNHLEKQIIRGRFKDARIHFAINCGSKSCPPIRPGAYDGDALDKDLDQQTKAFTLNSLGVQTTPDGKKAKVSPIFKWYDKDFQSEGGTREFINKARPNDLPTDAKVEYQSYDWSLNEAK